MSNRALKMLRLEYKLIKQHRGKAKALREKIGGSNYGKINFANEVW